MYRVVLIGLLISGCSNGAVHGQAALNEVAGTGPSMLGPNELSKARAEAEAGNVSAMASLENHYSVIGNTALYIKWLKRQVAAGDPYAMQRLSSYLQELGGELNCAAAASTLRRAIALTDIGELRQDLTQQLDLVEGRISGAPSCEHRPNNSFKPTPLRGAA